MRGETQPMADGQQKAMQAEAGVADAGAPAGEMTGPAACAVEPAEAEGAAEGAGQRHMGCRCDL